MPDGATFTALQAFGSSVTQWAFWLSAGSVILFANNRFRLQSIEPDVLDPPVHARSLTTRFRYGIAVFTYTSIYWAIFVILVSFGTIPEFRAVLESLVGEISLKSEFAVASPAWAALVATAIIPSVPGFKTCDQVVRNFLHDISSIPVKAHQLAKDILLAAKNGKNSDIQAFEKMQYVVDLLAEREDPATARLYNTFRKDNQDFLEDIKKKFTKVQPQTLQGDDVGYTAELLVKLSRFISCALLSSQPNELIARRYLKKLGLNVPEIGWQFRLEQIFLSVLVVIFFTMIGGYLANILLALFLNAGKFFDAGITIKYNIEFFKTLVKWVVFAVPMFTLPLIFSAGIKLHMVDKIRYRSELGDDDNCWDDLCLGYAIAFVGSLALACFPVLIGIATEINTQIALLAKGHVAQNPQTPPIAMDAALEVVKTTTAFQQKIEGTVIGGLVWALPPSVFSVIFIARSSKEMVFGKHISLLVDFLFHALPVGALSVVLSWVFITEPMDGLAPQQMAFMIGIVSALVSGTLGAVNCKSSRSALYQQMNETEETWHKKQGNENIPEDGEENIDEQSQTES